MSQRTVRRAACCLLLSACSAPSLELAITGFSVEGTRGTATVWVSGTTALGGPAQGTVSLTVLGATADATLHFDEAGEALGALECAATSNGCDGEVTVQARWERQMAELRRSLRRAAGSTPASAEPTAPPLGSSSTEVSSARPPLRPSPAPSCPQGTVSVFTGPTTLTVTVRDRDGTPSSSTVTLERGGQSFCGMTGTDGVVTFLGLEVGTWLASVGSVRAQGNVSGWNGSRQTIVIAGAADRTSLPSGW